MAIVVNKARPDEGTDRPYETHNRVNAGDPNGTLTPQYSGEIVLDTTTKCLWKAQGTANNTWVVATVSRDSAR